MVGALLLPAITELPCKADHSQLQMQNEPIAYRHKHSDHTTEQGKGCDAELAHLDVLRLQAEKAVAELPALPEALEHRVQEAVELPVAVSQPRQQHGRGGVSRRAASSICGMPP